MIPDWIWGLVGLILAPIAIIALGVLIMLIYVGWLALTTPLHQGINVKMKFLYAVKGCSHCGLRESCDLKNHRANLQDEVRVIREEKRTWWSRCKDFFRTPLLHQGGNVMKTNRRGIFEILLDILKGVRKPIIQNKLMTKTNLNYAPFSKYAEYLENMGFIMKVPPVRITRKAGRTERSVKFRYHITFKGSKLLRQISTEPLSDLLSYRTVDITGEM